MDKLTGTYLRKVHIMLAERRNLELSLSLSSDAFLSKLFWHPYKNQEWNMTSWEIQGGEGNWLGQHRREIKYMKLMRPTETQEAVANQKLALVCFTYAECSLAALLFVSQATINLPEKCSPCIFPTTWLGVQGANVLEPKSLTLTLHQSGWMS